MEVKFRLTTDDFVKLTNLLQNRKPWWRRWTFKFLFVPFLFLPFLYDGISIFDWGSMVPLLFGLIWAGLINIFPEWIMKPKFSKIMKNRPDLTAERTVFLTPAHLQFNTAAGVSIIYWNAIQKMANELDYLIFVTGPSTASMVPKRAFASPSAAQEFYETAKSFWGQAYAGNNLKV